MTRNHTLSISSLFTLLLLCQFCAKAEEGPDSRTILMLHLLTTLNDQASASGAGDRSYRYVFLTATHTGNFQGVSGADTFCNSSVPSGLGNTNSFKALLADTNRVATTDGTSAAGQTNWVLAPTREYRRTDGMTVFTSNAAALFTFGALTNAFSASAGNIWTGLDPDWQGNSPDCNNWTDGSAGANGEYGNAQSTTALAIHTVFQSCDQLSRLLCVEQ